MPFQSVSPVILPRDHSMLTGRKSRRIKTAVSFGGVAAMTPNPAWVLPHDDERSHSTSLDGQPMYGGADATGQSAMANDATAATHRLRNPGESLHGGPTLQERGIPPVAEGHRRHRNFVDAFYEWDS